MDFIGIVCNDRINVTRLYHLLWVFFVECISQSQFTYCQLMLFPFNSDKPFNYQWLSLELRTGIQLFFYFYGFELEMVSVYGNNAAVGTRLILWLMNFSILLILLLSQWSFIYISHKERCLLLRFQILSFRSVFLLSCHMKCRSGYFTIF